MIIALKCMHKRQKEGKEIIWNGNSNEHLKFAFCSCFKFPQFATSPFLCSSQRGIAALKAWLDKEQAAEKVKMQHLV